MNRRIALAILSVSFARTGEGSTPYGAHSTHGGYRNYNADPGWRTDGGSNPLAPAAPQEQQLEQVEPPLPPGWTEYFDQASGQPYYHNSIDGATTWERPVADEVPEVESPSAEMNETDVGGVASMEQPGGVGAMEQPGVGAVEQAGAGAVEQPGAGAMDQPGGSGGIDLQEPVNPGGTGIPPTETDQMAEPSQLANQGQGSQAPQDSMLTNYRVDGTAPAGGVQAPGQAFDNVAGQQQQQQHPPSRAWGVPEQQQPRTWGVNLDKPNEDAPRGPGGSEQPRGSFDPSGTYRPPGLAPGPESGGGAQEAQDPRAGPGLGPGYMQRDSPAQDASAQNPVAAGKPGGQPNMQIPNGEEAMRDRLAKQPGSGPSHGQPLARPQFPVAAGMPQKQAPPGQQMPQTGGQQRFGLPQVPNQQQQQQVPQGQPSQPSQQGSPDNRRPTQQTNPYGYAPPQMPQSAYGQPGAHRMPPNPAAYGQYGQYQQQQQQYGAYGQPPAQQSGQLVPQETTSAVRGALGSAWNSLLGFGNRTKTAVETATSSVVSTAKEAGQTISSTSGSLWGQAKETVGNFFEPGSEGQSPYSMSGNAQQPQAGAQGQPGSYPGQPGRYPYAPQQPAGMNPYNTQQQQGYPPRYPTQGQGYPGAQGQVPPGRGPPANPYPPGFRPPQPRGDQPGPGQQQQRQPPQRQGPPQQTQWGGYPQGWPQQQQQQQGGRGPPQQQPAKTPDGSKQVDGRGQGPPTDWSHPGLNPEF